MSKTERKFIAVVVLGIVIISLMVALLSCKEKPEFYIDGKGYRTSSRCIKSHSEIKYEFYCGWHNGLKYKCDWGWHGVDVCEQVAIDTIEVKIKEK